MEGGAPTPLHTAGRASALVGRPVEAGVVPSAADRRWAASVLHDLVVWGLDAGIPDAALRPVEVRLAQVAVELAPDEPVLGALLDWWLAVVVGMRPAQLWYVHPLPDELAAALLPGGWPPNLGSEVKQRRFADDTARLVNLAGTVPVLSQVAKAQAVVRDLNADLRPAVAALGAGHAPEQAVVAPLAERAEALLRASGVVEGTPLHTKVRRELEERVDLATDLAARARDLGPPVEPLPAVRVKALTRLAGNWPIENTRWRPQPPGAREIAPDGHLRRRRRTARPSTRQSGSGPTPTLACKAMLAWVWRSPTSRGSECVSAFHSRTVSPMT